MKKKLYTKNIFIFWCLSLIFIILIVVKERDSFYNNDIIKIEDYYLKENNIWGWFGWPWDNYIAICIHNNKCSEWQVKWIKSENEEIYIYFLPVIYSIEDMLTIFKDNSYSIFDNGIYYNLNNDINNAKIFWVFTQESMDFYSLNELEQLPKEQQEILQDIKERPRFIFE